MTEDQRGMNPKLILDEKLLEYHRTEDRKTSEARESPLHNTSQIIDKCADCMFFYNCKSVKLIELNSPNNVVTACGSYKSVSTLPNKSLEDVHNVFLKWFPNLDTTRIDTRLAVYLSNEKGEGNQIILFELARSGFLKSTLTEAFLTTPKVIPLDELTPHALVSGHVDRKGKPVQDKGLRFVNKHRVAIIGETAYMKAMEQGEKRKLFAIIKKWHDRTLQRDSGMGVEKRYDKCDTAMFFNSTKDFRRESVIQQVIGSCFLIDELPLDMKYDGEDVENALNNLHKQKQINKEIQEVVKCYLAHQHLKDKNLNEEEKKFINRETARLKLIRASAPYDKYDELEYMPEPEHPARMAIQLGKLYLALMSLNEDYDKNRATKIIRRIVDSSGDPALVNILETIDIAYWSLKQSGEQREFTVTNIRELTGLGTRTIKRRLELLVGLKFLKHKKKYSGKKGGRPGWAYLLRNDVTSDDWSILFRHKVVMSKVIT